MQHPPQGHLSLKSSLYAVGNSKWITQRLVQDHMDVHYKKLLNAKPAIDTRVPKSSITSVKARDSRRRTGAKSVTLGSRPASAAASVRASRAASHIDDQGSTGRNELIDELQSILSSRDVIDLDPKLAEELERRRQAPTPTWSPSTALSLAGPPSVNGSTTRIRSSLTQMGLGGAGVCFKSGRHRQIVGDHLDRFADRFKESGEFQPRLLKKPAQSRLAESRYYVPPRQYRLNRSATSAGEEMESAQSSSHVESSAKPPLPKGDTPSLATRKISPKTDKNKTAESPKQPSDTTAPPIVANTNAISGSSEAAANTAFDKINDSGCVRFISEVTQDILNRGVFTNKAIENVIQEHYIKNKGKLDERKLQLAMSSLREDFGLNETGPEKDAFIAVQEQYYSPSISRVTGPDSVLSGHSLRSEIMTPSLTSDRIPLSNASSLLKASEPTGHISADDDELNKTVDELIAKINEMEAKQPENRETSVNSENVASVKIEAPAINITSTAPEVPREVDPRKDSALPDNAEETKTHHPNVEEYEEDFE